jgi:hypothetical protein
MSRYSLHLSDTVNRDILTPLVQRVDMATFARLWSRWTREILPKCEEYFWKWEFQKPTARYIRAEIARTLLMSQTDLMFCRQVYDAFERAAYGLVADHTLINRTRRVYYANEEARLSKDHAVWRLEPNGDVVRVDPYGYNQPNFPPRRVQYSTELKGP